jgi:hypothetical protein
MSSAIVKRRDRIARVRRVEHALAAAAAAKADAHLDSLESSAQRVLDLRLTLTAGVGSLDAAMLAAKGELAHRLDVARFGLTDAIASARSAAELRKNERIAARIRQESAEKLRQRAADYAAAAAEKRRDAETRPRTPRTLGE